MNVAGAAAVPARENYCHYLAHELAAETPGAEVVSGWSLESVKRGRVNELRVVLDYHSVVRMPDGSLACPSTLRGAHIRFLEDVFRPFSMMERVVHNLAVFSNHPVAGARATRILPFVLTWAAPFGQGYLYSQDRKRSRWVSFGWANPFEFAAGQALTPLSIEELAFCSDLDAVTEWLGMELDRTPDEIVLKRVREAQPHLLRRHPD